MVRFTIVPSKSLNFGAVMLNNRKSKQIIIENNGEYEFKYSFINMRQMHELIKTRENLMNKESVISTKSKS